MASYPPSQARAWVRENFRGYFTAIYTPYRADGAIDHDALRRNVEITLGLPGVGGLSVHTIHQEFWTLTDTERRQVTETVLRTVGARKPVIVGVSDTSAANVIEFARHADDHGAAAVMVWPPYYGVKSADGVRQFYEQVAAGISIGMFAYSTTLSELGFYLTPDMAQQLLPIPLLVGLQSTVAGFAQHAAMLERVGRDIAVATSLEETFLFSKVAFGERAPDFMMGSSRPLFVQNHAHPRCSEFLAAVQERDFERAGRHLRGIMAIADSLQSRYFAQGFHHVALFKQLSTHLGLAGGAPRAPMSAPSANEVEECARIMREAGLEAPRAD